MKRIIFYAAAAGIFVSSVLAKPARGAERFPGQGPGVAQGQGCERFPCQGLGMAQGQGCERFPGKDPEEAQKQGDEWFPGQGPETAQKPGTERFPGRGPETAQEQDVEWFPGQGPETAQDQGDEWFPGQGPETAQDQGTEWFPGQGPETAQKPGVEWFPGQGSETEQTPDVQLPWTEWFPWLNGQGGSFWQPGTGDFWWGGAGDTGNTGNTGGTGNSSGNSGSGGSSAEVSYITRIAELVNARRAEAGLSPVTVSSELSAAADVRAREITGSFSHYRPNGTYFNTVLDQRSISYNGAGENIAYGYDTPERVMTEWMNSASHRANILDSRFTRLGVGYYEQNGVKYWTQLFTY